MTTSQLDRNDTGLEAQLQALSDKAAIADVIHNYAAGVDGHDWTLFRSCFADELEADFTSLKDMGHFRGPSDTWVAAAKTLMENLDATQHLMGNIQVELDGDRAVARNYLHAQHVRNDELGERHYIIAGHYRHELVRTDKGWRIAKYSLTAQWTSGNRAVMVNALARARGKK